MRPSQEARALRPLPGLIFASRWLQLPLCLGLIVAQGIYVWLFWQELYYPAGGIRQPERAKDAYEAKTLIV
jgi:uncharacterized membrane protein YqhA